MAPALEEHRAEVVVVGTGAGGATAAHVLAASGRDVLMLEEGPHLKSAERPREALRALSMVMRDGATQAAMGRSGALPLLQGVCVGGSTAVNSGIIWRLPEDVRRLWIRRHGLGPLLAPETLERVYAAIEDDLEVATTGEEVLGGNAALMALASERLGLPGQPIRATRHAALGMASACKGVRSRLVRVWMCPTCLRLFAAAPV